MKAVWGRNWSTSVIVCGYVVLFLFLWGEVFVFLATSEKSRADWGSLPCHPPVHLCQWNKECLCLSLVSLGSRLSAGVQGTDHLILFSIVIETDMPYEREEKKKLELDWNGIIKVKWNALFWFKCRMMLRDLANRILFLFSLWGSSW